MAVTSRDFARYISFDPNRHGDPIRSLTLLCCAEEKGMNGKKLTLIIAAILNFYFEASIYYLAIPIFKSIFISWSPLPAEAAQSVSCRQC